MRQLLALTLCCLLIPTPVLADEASHRAAAERDDKVFSGKLVCGQKV